MPQPKNRRRAAPQDLDYVSPLCLCGDEQGSKWATAKPIAVVHNLAQLQRFYASLKPAARTSVLKTPPLPELLPQVVDACELGIEHASALAAKYLTNSTMVDGARQYLEQVLAGEWPLLPGSPPGLRMSDELVTLAANQLGGGLLKRFGGCTPVSTIVVPNKLGLIRFPSEAEGLPESVAAMKEASDQGVCRPMFGVHYRPWSDEDEVYVYRGLLDCCRLISGIIVVLQRRLHRAMMRAELVKQLTKSGPTAAGALTIADSCQTWSWGVGGQGQLGLGAVRHADTPTPIPALADQRVIQVAAAGSHALALSTYGTSSYGVLFGWGSGQQGATGLHDTEPSRVPLPCSAVSYTPQLIPRPVQMVAAGELHTLALQGERCYGWGAAWLGQLGNTTMLLEGGCLLPYEENDYMPITTLVPGMSFSPEYLEAINPAAAAAARAAAAQRRAMGQGVDDGQMEHEGRHPACLVMLSGAPVAFGPRINPDKRGCRPGKILTDIVAIAAGGMHSLCATRDGACWIWGCNEALSLGIKVTEEEMQQPWVQAMGCGCCDGKDMVIISVSAPVEVDLDGVASGKVVGVAAGASISVILTDEGEVVTWGASRRDPWRVDRQFKERGAAVAAGGMYAMAVTRDTGSVWIWARNHINEWSNDRDPGAPRPKHQAWLPRKVPFLSNVERADCSSTHCIASTRDGCVYWWPHSAMAPGQPAPAAGSYEVVTLRGLSVLSVAVGDNFALCSTGSPPTEEEEEEGGMAQAAEAMGPPVQGNGALHKEQEPAPHATLAPVNQQL